jgi:hypothetical protein
MPLAGEGKQMRTVLPIAAVGVSLLLSAAPAHAHHSFAAEYDENRPITLTGTVTGMQWVNPHSRLTLDVTGADGKVVNWTVEFGAVEALMRRGWKKTDLAVGSEDHGPWLPRQGWFARGRQKRDVIRRLEAVGTRLAAPERSRAHGGVHVERFDDAGAAPAAHRQPARPCERAPSRGVCHHGPRQRRTHRALGGRRRRA